MGTALRVVKVWHCFYLGRGALDTSADIVGYESVLSAPDETRDEVATSKWFARYTALKTTEDYFNVFFPAQADPSMPPCLFSDVTVSDIIAWCEGGRCNLCNNQRYVCPSCGGMSQFDVFMGCGVNLACPLCMGHDFLLEDKEYLKTHYWDEAPADDEEERRERVNNRLAELGYALAKWD